MGLQLLVITPAFNEEGQLHRVADGIKRQTRPPTEWVLVDDGSTDGTPRVLEEIVRDLPFARRTSTGRSPGRRYVDPLAAGRAAIAFNAGLRSSVVDWDCVAKIDADVELPAHYFAELLQRVEADPGLGMASGVLYERSGRRWKRVRTPAHHVCGPIKLYRRECLEAIGGVPASLGWDTVDETLARMRGYRTRSYADLAVRHLRPTGAASGLLRGRARHGACAWIAHYPWYWVMLRSLKLMAARPVVISGLAFAWGFARAGVSSVPRVDHPDFRAHIRRELRLRVRARGAFTDMHMEP